MLQKIRHMGMESKYSVLSFMSVIGVVVLHGIHWALAPLLMGAASEMRRHHQDMEGTGSIIMGLFMLVLFLVNIASMYFACRQLGMAWMNRTNVTRHTYLCCGLSVVVLGIGIYTLFSF
ncbi:hypothetical protein [Paenibacillus nasutitermitis]|uniref:Uncharacterized protein n=1 Tax=Paenibacillus nasutitermitis TaxID=1652958 RepID=A0A916YPY1_9BACL|nr:hypothetical protein [Paenibacillus nasutitermitis]GGD53789.1 hypothetical protein GCM10010911_09140 [Paenibacillus nasutitermitis]